MKTSSACSQMVPRLHDCSHVGAERSPAVMLERPEWAEEMIVIGYKMSFVRREEAGGEEGL